MTTAAETTLVLPTRRTRWFRRLLIAVLTLAVISVGIGTYWWEALQVYHFGQIQPGVLYRDGNRDLREFQHALKFGNIRTVVSLVDDRELNDPDKPQFKQEADYCQSHGIQQIRIPVKLGGWPTRDQILQFFNIVAVPGNRPVLVHCAQGVRRTGMFMAAYQLSVMDRSVPFAKATIQSFGHKDKDLDDVRTFIDAYDPTMGTLPDNLPTRSGE